MCKKNKALHYLKHYDIVEEMNLYSTEYLYPEVSETIQWCDENKNLKIFVDVYAATLIVTGTLALSIFTFV